MDKVDRALELRVIDWLQWADFQDDSIGRGDVDMAQLALTLISKRKNELQQERERSQKLIEALEFECGNRCAAGLNPCNAREAIEQYRKEGE